MPINTLEAYLPDGHTRWKMGEMGSYFSLLLSILLVFRLGAEAKDNKAVVELLSDLSMVLRNAGFKEMRIVHANSGATAGTITEKIEM